MCTRHHDNGRGISLPSLESALIKLYETSDQSLDAILYAAQITNIISAIAINLYKSANITIKVTIEINDFGGFLI